MFSGVSRFSMNHLVQSFDVVLAKSSVSETIVSPMLTEQSAKQTFYFSGALSYCCRQLFGAVSYVLKHPVRAVTTGLVMQQVAVMASEPVGLSLSGLDGSNGFVLNGVSIGMDDYLGHHPYVGWLVSDAGDVNGDGIGDLIISANDYAQATYVVFGHTGSWTSPMSLSTLDGANGFKLTGVPSGDYPDRRFPSDSGDYSAGPVANAGDVNGDGISDLIITAPYANNGAGATYVVFGHTGSWTSPVSLSTLNGTNGFILDLVGGGHVSFAAGDVNGDGISDLIIGALLANDYAGATYVVFGHTGSWTSPVSFSTLNGANGFTLPGLAYNDQSGCSVAAGDVNGDGISDLIIGAYLANDYAGATYVVLGHTGSWTSPMSLSTLNGANGFKLEGVADEVSGGSVAAGDVNGDGISDLIIGAPNANNAEGATHVVFGHTGSWSSPMSLSTLNGANGFTLTGAGYGFSGSSVANAGDVNGDGISDLIIGAIANHYAGATYVVFGHTGSWSSPMSLSTLNGANGFTLSGAEYSGGSVANAGDVNGDGIGDLIIGATTYQATNNATVSYVVFGFTALGTPTTATSAAISSTGTVSSSETETASISSTLTSSITATPTSTQTPTITRSIIPVTQTPLSSCGVNFRVATLIAELMVECAMSSGACGQASPALLFNRITNDETTREKLRQATAQNICKKYLASPTPVASKRKAA